MLFLTFTVILHLVLVFLVIELALRLLFVLKIVFVMDWLWLFFDFILLHFISCKLTLLSQTSVFDVAWAENWAELAIIFGLSLGGDLFCLLSLFGLFVVLELVDLDSHIVL